MPEELEVTPVETQEEQAAPSTEEQNESTESATGEPEPQGEDKPSKGGFQRRIDKLTKEKSDAEREREFWRQEALRNLPKVETKAEETPEPEKPARDKYASDEDFFDALADWKLDQREKIAEQKQAAKTAVQPLFEAREKFAASVDDYHDTMKAATDVPVTANMLPYLNDPEIGPELGYFLAKNPDEAQRLAKLGAAATAKAIVELSSRFKPDAPVERQATVSKAPPPPSPAGKTSAQSTKDPGDMSPADYRAWRAKTYPDL